MSKLIIVFILLTLSIITGCESSPPSRTLAEPQASVASPTSTQDDAHIIAEYRRISPQEAQEMFSENTLILDVRTRDEYDAGHIRNAVLLPHSEIREKAESLISDRDQVILVYCRAGSRSEAAARELIALGYTKVFDFGGILDWTGEIVIEATNGG